MKKFMSSLSNLRRLTLVISLGTAGLLTTAMAAEKGAQTLMTLAERGVKTTAVPLQTVDSMGQVQAGDSVITACPDCKNVVVTRMTKPKPHISQTKAVSVHQCPGCETKIELTGQGKAATRKITHTCPKCGGGKAFCSVMKAPPAAKPAPAKPDTDAQPATPEGHDHSQHQQ